MTATKRAEIGAIRKWAKGEFQKVGEGQWKKLASKEAKAEPAAGSKAGDAYKAASSALKPKQSVEDKIAFAEKEADRARLTDKRAKQLSKSGDPKVREAAMKMAADARARAVKAVKEAKAAQDSQATPKKPEPKKPEPKKPEPKKPEPKKPEPKKPEKESKKETEAKAPVVNAGDVQRLAQQTDRLQKSLSDDQLDALRSYTTTSSTFRAVEQGHVSRERAPELVDKVETLHSMFKDPSIERFEGTVYRGLSSVDESTLQKWSSSDQVTFDGTSSSSVDPKVALDFSTGKGGVLLRIKQSKGLPVGKISVFDDQEEVLLGKGSRFRFKGRSSMAGGETTIIDLEEIDG